MENGKKKENEKKKGKSQENGKCAEKQYAEKWIGR